MSRAHDLRVRLFSALVMAPTALVCLALGEETFALFVAVGAVLVMREWVRMVNDKQNLLTVVVGAGFVIAAMIAALYDRHAFALLLLGAGTAAVAIVAPDRRVWSAAGVLYAGIPAVSLVFLRGLEHGTVLVLFLLLVIWVTDIAAYSGGRAIGGAKLWPAVSPKKTWAGFVSGLAGAAAAGLAISMFGQSSQFLQVAPITAMLAAMTLSVAGQGGDLYESFMKRFFGVKDSGSMIPGHGGAMDRLDSLVAAAGVAAVMAVLAEVPEPLALLSVQAV